MTLVNEMMQILADDTVRYLEMEDFENAAKSLEYTARHYLQQNDIHSATVYFETASDNYVECGELQKAIEILVESLSHSPQKYIEQITWKIEILKNLDQYSEDPIFKKYERGIERKTKKLADYEDFFKSCIDHLNSKRDAIIHEMREKQDLFKCLKDEIQNLEILYPE